MNDETKCTFPYKQIRIDPSGIYTPCCQFTPQIDDPSSLRTVTSLTEYINSDQLKKIKSDLDSGIKIPECDFCWRQEKDGFTSMRQSAMKRHNNQFPDVDYRDNGITEFFVEFGNMCNTACRICNGARSSLIAKYQREYIKKNPDTSLKSIFVDNETINKNKFWYSTVGEEVLEFVESLDYIQVSGGEPFINVYFDKFIDTLINSGKTLPEIRITTNGSFSKKQLDKLKHFKKVDIFFSTDSLTKKYYEYLRWPLKHEGMLQSIELLDSHENGNIKNHLKCEFKIVLHNLNLLDIAPTIDTFNELFIDNEKFKLSFTHINTSDWYKVHNSPKWVREKVIQDLENVNFHKRIKPEKDVLIKFLSSEIEPSELDSLAEHVKFTDGYRENTNTWDFLGWSIDDIDKTE